MSFTTVSAKRTKKLAFCAICTALALVCSFIRTASLPFGGSITLFSMFFIALSGFAYGPGAGMLTGISYSILFFFLEPYIYSPLQFFFDYPLAFAMLGGLSGLFFRQKERNSKKPRSSFLFPAGYALGVTGRYLCHVASGCLFFADYASSVQNPLIYSLLYNLTYIVPEMILTLILLSFPATRRLLCRITCF